MRKGRSSRRSRNSRPVSKAPPPTETLGAESTPSNPRIVLSSTPPPASIKTDAAQPSRVPSAPEPDAPTSEPPPVSEATAKSPDVEPKTSEPPPEPEPKASEPPPPPPPDDTTSNPPPETRPSATLPPPAHEEEPKDPPVTIASTDDVPREPPSPRADEPPAEDGEDDEVESAEHVAIQEQFFSEGDLSRHDHDDIEPVRPSKAVRMAEPAVVERRARYSRYVGWAVAGAAIVCLAAVGRTLVGGGGAEKPAPVLETRPGPPLTIERPPEPKPAETAVTPPSPVPEPSASASAAPDEPPPRPTGDAKDEKKKAQAALEQRKIADAIAAGEASVAIDPTDGEAWLILGAAYQEKGDIASARRSFAACVKEGKTGPVAECGKMLR